MMSAELLAEGPFGIGWLRPQALLGIEGIDPLMHALFWSIVLNTFVFCVVSIATFPDALERLQGEQFVGVFGRTAGAGGWAKASAEAEDLMMMAQRILGAREAQELFRGEARRQEAPGDLPSITPALLDRLERRLSGSVGSATAHAMVRQIAGNTSPMPVEDLLRVADEAQRTLEYSSRLEIQSAELARTAGELQRANEKLTELSIQKDAFLNQISHELRTPMASIRSFSEILRDEALGSQEQRRFAGVIHAEALRLTRLLDDLLDLSVLENAQPSLNISTGTIAQMIDQAIQSTGIKTADRPLRLDRRRRDEQVEVITDTDRLTQVFINLIGNAHKYCDAEMPLLRIRVHQHEGHVAIDFLDNGSGVPERSREIIFEKFARLDEGANSGGAGLGLAICREIMARLGGSITYLPGQVGAAFRVSVPTAAARAA
ncbi:MAG: HAMP domain-containing sensor histidine kinase [Pseudomonadota bacterium]